MKIKTKNVYYCDYCKKHSLRSLEKHEKHCTMNPNRDCRMCGRENVLDLVEKYKRAIVSDRLMKDIQMSVDDCPNCTLAILRQTGLIKTLPTYKLFDYQTEIRNWWHERDEEVRIMEIEYDIRDVLG